MPTIQDHYLRDVFNESPRTKRTAELHPEFLSSSQLSLEAAMMLLDLLASVEEAQPLPIREIVTSREPQTLLLQGLQHMVLDEQHVLFTGFIVGHNNRICGGVFHRATRAQVLPSLRTICAVGKNAEESRGEFVLPLLPEYVKGKIHIFSSTIIRTSNGL